uniref:Uncharacterized protein n=1 Tax=Tanacetum cinerariifolium TaxID=118510 RepID=A0A699H6G5_TANCI|nr:hypothetical protein [Tanacetum cinerariifolium]
MFGKGYAVSTHARMISSCVKRYSLYIIIKRRLYVRGRSLCFVLEMLNNVTPPDTYSVQAPSEGVTDCYQEPSVRTPTGRVILFGTIPTIIPNTPLVIVPPTTQTDTTVIPTETPIITPTIPPLPATSPFLSSNDDTIDSDTPDTPPSPTHGTPFTEITASTYRSPVIPRRRVIILPPGQSIPHGRPYRYHPNWPVHMMTSRTRVGPLPVQQLDVRHSVDHSSSDYFYLDDLTRDSSSDSSSKASSDFHLDASSDSSSRHSLSDHSSPDLPSTSAGPSCKRRMSLMTYVPALPTVSGALSPVRADLIPSPKRVRDYGYLADVEVEIDECLAYTDALRDKGIDARVIVETVDRDEIETGVRGPVKGAIEVTYETLGDLVQRFLDHTHAILVHRVQVIEGVQKEQGRRIFGVESAVTALTERVAELERDNRRLRGTASVESHRVDRLQRGMSHMQRDK